ncbi:SRPBCC family protein [Isosphaeraceae bacterium EP7]
MSTLSTHPTGAISAEEIRAVEDRNRSRLAHVNVADAERWASAVGGGLLATYGLKRGSLGGLALAAIGGALMYRGYTGQCAVYRALEVDTAAGTTGKLAEEVRGGTLVKASLTVDRPAAELFAFWSDVDNLKQFMNHVESISRIDDSHSRWVVKGPFGVKLQWDSEIITSNPPEVISWSSVPGGDLTSAGSVQFRPAPGDRGTEVTLEVNFEPPAGIVGQAIAKFMGESPERVVHDHLRRFKQLMETGEVAANGSLVRPA